MEKVEQREVEGPHNVGLFALQSIHMNSIFFREKIMAKVWVETVARYCLK